MRRRKFIIAFIGAVAVTAATYIGLRISDNLEPPLSNVLRGRNFAVRASIVSHI